MGARRLGLIAVLVLGAVCQRASAKSMPKSFLDTVAKKQDPHKRVQQRRGNRPLPFEAHPIAHHINPNDLTLHLPAVDPHEFNDPKKIMVHHKGTLAMAKKYGFSEEDLKRLGRSLKVQLQDYAKNKKKQDRYDKIKDNMSRKKRDEAEAGIKEKANKIHHELFKIKSKIVRQARRTQIQGWDLLKELAGSSEFTEADRKSLLDEIKTHVGQTQKFYQLHLRQNQNLHKGLKQNKLTPKQFEEKIKASKRKAIEKQQQVRVKEKELLLSMRSRLAGDL